MPHTHTFKIGDRVTVPTFRPNEFTTGRVSEVHASGRIEVDSAVTFDPSLVEITPCPPGQPDDGERREIARRLALGETVKVRMEHAKGLLLTVRQDGAVKMTAVSSNHKFQESICELVSGYVSCHKSAYLTIDRDE